MKYVILKVHYQKVIKLSHRYLLDALNLSWLLISLCLLLFMLPQFTFCQRPFRVWLLLPLAFVTSSPGFVFCEFIANNIHVQKSLFGLFSGWILLRNRGTESWKPQSNATWCWHRGTFINYFSINSALMWGACRDVMSALPVWRGHRTGESTAARLVMSSSSWPLPER